VDAAGNLQVDVIASGLPAGAATAANQLTEITALQLIDDLRNALQSVATDRLIVDVIASGLPAGAATAANQALILAQLQLIEDLRNALQSEATDRLQVRGADQLFSYKGQYIEQVVNLNAAAGGNFLTGTVVPPNEVWVITVTHASNNNKAGCGIFFQALKAGVGHTYHVGAATPVVVGTSWSGMVFLVEGDCIQTYIDACDAGNDLYLNIFGYKMTKE